MWEAASVRVLLLDIHAQALDLDGRQGARGADGARARGDDADASGGDDLVRSYPDVEVFEHDQTACAELALGELPLPLQATRLDAAESASWLLEQSCSKAVVSFTPPGGRITRWRVGWVVL